MSRIYCMILYGMFFLVAAEFKQQYLGLNRDLQGKGKMKIKKAVVPSITLPPEFDWRHYNVVTPVKNQVNSPRL